jgi:DNA-binding transcriptional regulator YiaG
LPFSDILNKYPTLHEADITKFYAAADEIYAREHPQTNLKRIREAAGLSQSQLAASASVSLRSIQMFEQRNKDINKAQALTLVKIARALGCEVENLLERRLNLPLL